MASFGWCLLARCCLCALIALLPALATVRIYLLELGLVRECTLESEKQAGDQLQSKWLSHWASKERNLKGRIESIKVKDIH